MSNVNVLFYRTEAGVHTNPAEVQYYQTSCLEGVQQVNKQFREVLIHWEVDQWVEDAVYIPGQSVVALKITNQCDSTFAYAQVGYNDFRLYQVCCFNQEEGEGLFIITEDGENILTEDGDGILTE